MTDPLHAFDLQAAAARRERRSEELIEQKTALVTYLRSKLIAEDWHAVQDAASDIREIVAVLKELHA